MKLQGRLVGAQALRTKLQAAAAALTSDQLETAVEAGAMVIENEWKRLAPVKTGTYRRSIHHETTEKAKDHVTVVIGTDVDYAVYLEYGTRKMAPRPSARPAFDSKKGEAGNEIQRVIKQNLSRL